MTNKKTLEQAWGQAKNLIKQEVSKSVYDLRIKDLTVGQYSDDVIMIRAEGHHVDWLNARLSTTASKTMAGILGQPVNILFSNNGNPPPSLAMEGRKAQLTQAYGETRAAVIQPHKALFVSHYFWQHWRPLLGKGTASDVVIACRSLCYWNVKTGEIRNTVTTDREQLAELACCSPASVDRALNNKLVKMYFVQKKIARIMTEAGPRNHGLILRVRMDDPLTPEHQAKYKINEPTTWLDPAED